MGHQKSFKQLVLEGKPHLVWASGQEPRLWGLKSGTLQCDSTDRGNVVKTNQHAPGS